MPQGKILIVEDSELTRTIYGDNLTMAGYEVETASDGQEGLEKLQTFHPDIILTDLVMPRMTGIQLLQKLKSDPLTDSIPIVVLTESQNEERLKESLKLGVEEFIRKSSISPNEISAKVGEILEKLASAPNGEKEALVFKVAVRDREQDADKLIDHVKAPRRFWCQKCEEEMFLELRPNVGHADGTWFEARFVCPRCGGTL